MQFGKVMTKGGYDNSLKYLTCVNTKEQHEKVWVEMKLD